MRTLAVIIALSWSTILVSVAAAEVIRGSNSNREVEVLIGGDSDDVISGRGGPDSIHGNAGNDYLAGGPGSDSIHGMAGDDIILGGRGSDRMTGGIGIDLFIGGPGNDRINAGENHLFTVDPRGNLIGPHIVAERDFIACGAGRDAIVADELDFVSTDCEVVRRDEETPGSLRSASAAGSRWLTSPDVRIT